MARLWRQKLLMVWLLASLVMLLLNVIICLLVTECLRKRFCRLMQASLLLCSMLYHV